MPKTSGYKTTNKKSGFEDIQEHQIICMHPEHNPPMHLHIPMGKRYRHVCPGCGQERVIYPMTISFQS